MPKSAIVVLAATLMLGGASPLAAVIFVETADPSYHTSTPGNNSGWQYSGEFGGFLGVPIAPHFFITANHFGGDIGGVFNLHGDMYFTIGFHDLPATDLRIWEVNHTKPFPTYAPLSSGVADIGATAVILGRGTQRGSEILVSGQRKGWRWGPSDGVKRWGRNQVAKSTTLPDLGEFLVCDFNSPEIADECHLSVGDSGGGMFIFENGLWRLAGIHYAVDGPFRTDSTSPPFDAALFDIAGLETNTTNGWTATPEQLVDIPSGFYSSRISASLPGILALAPAAATLASENFPAWQRLYFSPSAIATPALSGPLADPDQDGIGNLLEFALNLDPTFPERATLAADSGVGGLPRAYRELVFSVDHLALEFVRRTQISGAGLTCVAEFSSDLLSWTAAGTETVTAINPRWERVKTVDSLATTASLRRFTRLKVE